MKIKFLKFLWVILIVPSLYGMENLAQNSNKRPYSLSEVQTKDQGPNSKKAKTDKKYGVVKHSLDDCPDLINVVKQILKVDVSTKEKAKDLIIEAFGSLDENKIEGTNFILWNGTINLNGLIPISDFDDSLKIEGVREKPYPVMQLCEVLGYKDKKIKKKLEAAGKIAYCSPLIYEALTWNTIYKFWYDIRGKGNRQINSMFTKHMKKSKNWPEKDPKFDTYLIATADYMKSLNDLKIYTRNLKFNEKGLSESFYKVENKTKDLMKGYLEAFGKYIKELDENDGSNFLKHLKGSKSYLNDIYELNLEYRENTLSYYKKYTHTEWIVRYLRKQEPLHMMSYCDPCTSFKPHMDRCEQMLAEITPEDGDKPNTVVISGCPYYDSRNSGVRQAMENSNLINYSLWLYQLSPESSHKN